MRRTTSDETTRVLVVDDSALMRKVLVGFFEKHAQFSVQAARNGVQALQMLEEFCPHVITMDINMPEMDGLTALSEIMVRRPTPVIMVSSLTSKDALPTFEALALGAVDFVAKPGGTVSMDMHKVEREIIQKVAAARSARAGAPQKSNGVKARVAGRGTQRAVSESQVQQWALHPSMVVVGVSTGGPRTLEAILPLLPSDFAHPVLVAIHMPGTFTGAFAKRMAQLCELPVQEVERQTDLKPGTIYIGKGDLDMIVAKRGGRMVVMSTPPDPGALWHPCVDRLLESAMRHVSCNALLGVQLTGMGNDGVEQMKALHTMGGVTIAESEETAVVFGMPRMLIECRGASLVLPATAIGGQINSWANQLERAS